MKLSKLLFSFLFSVILVGVAFAQETAPEPQNTTSTVQEQQPEQSSTDQPQEVSKKQNLPLLVHLTLL